MRTFTAAAAVLLFLFISVAVAEAGLLLLILVFSSVLNVYVSVEAGAHVFQMYRGWYWAVSVARASSARNVTVDEVVLLPGEQALIATAWVPWSERLQPGDLSAAYLTGKDGRVVATKDGRAGAQQVAVRWADGSTSRFSKFVSRED